MTPTPRGAASSRARRAGSFGRGGRAGTPRTRSTRSGSAPPCRGGRRSSAPPRLSGGCRNCQRRASGPSEQGLGAFLVLVLSCRRYGCSADWPTLASTAPSMQCQSPARPSTVRLLSTRKRRRSPPPNPPVARACSATRPAGCACSLTRRRSPASSWTPGRNCSASRPGSAHPASRSASTCRATRWAGRMGCGGRGFQAGGSRCAQAPLPTRPRPSPKLPADGLLQRSHLAVPHRPALPQKLPLLLNGPHHPLEGFAATPSRA